MTPLAILLLGLAAPGPALAQTVPPSAAEAAPANPVNAAIREGQAALNHERPADALAAFDRVVALVPDWAPGHAYRVMALTELRRYPEAEAEMAIALRLGESIAFVQQTAGYLQLMLGEFEPAIRAFTRSLALKPDNIDVLDRRAQAYQGLGRLDESLADFDRILAIAPGDPNVHFQRARVFAHLGLEAEMLAAIERAAASSGSAYYLVWKGDFLSRFGRSEEAAAAYRAALARLDARGRPETPGSSALETRLNLLSRIGRHSDAIARIDAALRDAPRSAALLAARCWVAMEANSLPEQALVDCDRALAAEPNHPVAAAARARLFLRLERWPDAERAFMALLANGGRSESNALYGRGIARIQMGDGAQGERDLREARHRKFDVAAEFARLGLNLTVRGERSQP